MSKWHGGKGSKQRPTDHKKFDDNWERIFGKKKKKESRDSVYFHLKQYKYNKEEEK